MNRKFSVINQKLDKERNQVFLQKDSKAAQRQSGEKEEMRTGDGEPPICLHLCWERKDIRWSFGHTIKPSQGPLFSKSTESKKKN